MHILFVLDVWGLAGGTERYAAVVIPALIERGHRVTVLCRESQPSAQGCGERGAAERTNPVEVIEEPDLLGQGLTAKAREHLRAALAAAAPDVAFASAMRNYEGVELLLDAAPLVRYVHDHTLFCPGLNKYYENGDTCRKPMGIACLSQYYLGGGCIGFKRAMYPGKPLDPLRRLRFKQRGLKLWKRATHTLTNSRYMREELLKVGFSRERTSVLPLFTRSNTEEQPASPLAPELEAFLASGRPLIFTPARLTLPDKGVDYLLTTLALVREDCCTVICGDGPARDFLEAKAAEDGIGERVLFSGWLGSGAVETLYDRAALVVCPSVWDEPFGLVGLEAMAHEKPLVAFDVGGIGEWLIDGQNGFLLPRKDTGGMAQAIDRLLRDADLRRRLGTFGRASMRERFSRSTHLDQLESVLAGAARKS